VRAALAILAACFVAGCGAARPTGTPTPSNPGLLVFGGVVVPVPEPPGLSTPWHQPISYYALHPDGTGLRKLAFSSDERDLGFSADGRFAAMWDTSPDDKSRIVVSRADGSERHVVSFPNRTYADVLSPSLSPDAKSVAFGYTPDYYGDPPNYEGDPQDLWTVSTDGQGLKRLTKTGDVLSVDWSPDGTRIAFLDGSRLESSSDGAVGDIYVVRADGSELHRIATGFTGQGRAVVWSPDGKRIAFQDSKQRLSIVDADGGNVDALAPHGEAPAWSPDGTRLAFLRVVFCRGYIACTRSRIFIVDVDGGTPREVGPNFGNPVSLSWTTATLRPTPTGSKIGSPPSS
jgi:Tol biopolymer transport system component